ncbi:malonyl-CoA:anthocyanidin O-glucoside-6''-O-malonyltransferase [Salix suchowensis]|nr:malonyl-CoA:anthocyanidin O-glucoside-6''-O-malonyltransferase [Salix suchowensis]
MAPSNSVKILELRQVAPACSSTDQSSTEFTLPLTFMDALWLKFPPAESIFFYELTESSPTVFISIILPKLITSLSRALVNFLPLAGNLIWPQDSPKPLILYTPNDAVSLTIAESSSDFGRLSSNEIREAIELHPYTPDLCISDTRASVLALQITLFPNQGFCISFVTHHAALDGKTTAMFIKAWAHICKHLEPGKIDQPPLLPADLIPSFDRSVIKDVAGLETEHLNYWLVMNEVVLKSNPRSLKVLPNIGGPEPSDLVRATFELSREDIKFLRKKVQSQFDRILKEDRNETKQLHLSTFVLTCAYTGRYYKSFLLFSVDLRSRSLDPPIPNNYFGNCIAGQHVVAEARIFTEENGLAMIAEKGLFEGARERLAELASLEPGTQCLGVAGSTRFDFYRSDFGWGEPEKVEIASIDRTNSVSLVESRDGMTGGVEIGLALKTHEMESFASLFVNGLKDN